MTKKKRVYSFTSTVRKVAAKGWGKTLDSQESAEREMVDHPSSLAGAAALEIVRRLNQVIRALAEDRSEDDPEPQAEIPDYAEKYPDAKVGDMFYRCEDLELGVYQLFVVACEGGIVRVCSECDLHDMEHRLGWGFNMHRTIEDALRHRAERDVAYHAPGLRAANDVLEAIEKKQDLTRFVNPEQTEDME